MYLYTDFLVNTDSFQTGCTSLTPNSSMWEPRLPPIFTNTSQCLSHSHHSGVCLLSCYFNLHSSNKNNIEHLFTGVLAFWRPSVMKHLFKPLPNLIGLFVISLLICRTSNTFELTNTFMVMNWSLSALKLSSTVLMPQLSHEPITKLKTEEPRQEPGFPKIPIS